MKYKEAEELFNKYVDSFDNKNDKVDYKYKHSFRVAALALEIAKSLNLSEEDIELAHVCGLLHDIGRFFQVTEFNTYHDIDSCDHGDVGYDVLKSLGVNDSIILKSTKYHNKREVPDDLTEREELFLNITRDADKLDILANCCLDIPKDELKITDEVVKVFEKRSLTIDKDGDTSDAMQYLRCVSFIFDINFDYSYKYIKKHDLILSKLNSLLKISKDERLLDIKEIVNNYINERVD